METVALYRQLLRQLIEDEARQLPDINGVETLILIDEQHDQYQLLHAGWDQTGRVFGVVIHARLHDGKIWIEQDGTADGLANALVAAGVPPDQIVLAFHPAWKRQYTHFAVA